MEYVNQGTNSCCFADMDETLFIIPATTITRKGSRTVSSKKPKQAVAAQQFALLLSQLMILNLFISHI
jgi:hypothetical protein